MILAALPGCAGSGSGTSESSDDSAVRILRKSDPNSFGEHSDGEFSDGTIDTNEFDRFFTTASVRGMMGDHFAAIRYFNAALRAVPGHFPSIEGLARSWYALENYDSALSVARNLPTDVTPDVEFRQLLAELWLRTGVYDSASAEYERILTERPNDLQSRFSIARTWERRNPAKAIRHYEYIRDYIAEDYNSLVGLFQVQSERGNNRQAAAALNLLIAHRPDDPGLHDLLCGLWIDASQYDSGIAALLRADLFLVDDDAFVEFLKPQLSLTELRISTSYYPDSGLQRFADTIVQLVVRRAHDRDQVTFAAGKIALRLQRDSIADDLLAESFEREGLSATQWDQAAELYLERNAPQRLLNVLRPSASRYARSAEVSLSLGTAFRETGEIDSARTWLNRSVASDPGTGDAWRMLADIEIASGNIGQGVAAFEEALSSAPYDPVLLNDYARALADGNVLLEKARSLNDKALDIEPENEEFLTTAGRIEYLVQDYDAAVGYLQRAVDAGGATVERLELLGDAGKAAGRNDVAQKAYRDALRVLGNDAGRRAQIERKLNESGL